MPKTMIDYDSVTKIGAVYYDGVQVCDIGFTSWQAEAIDQLIKEHILNKGEANAK